MDEERRDHLIRWDPGSVCNPKDCCLEACAQEHLLDGTVSLVGPANYRFLIDID